MIKVHDIAYVRFSAPNLDEMERFLTDFGLAVTAREDETLYCRGTDGAPYIHVTEQGPAGFLSFGFEVVHEADLEAAARLEGASAIEEIQAPGGGRRVNFQDPDGNGVEIVHGRKPLPDLPVSAASAQGDAKPVNLGSERRRLGTLRRVERGIASVKRLGHAVVRVADFARSRDWYQSKFGFLSSDDVYLGDESNIVTSFMRCDRGDDYTDHHTLLCVGIGEPGFDHAAFEVEDVDAVMVGHDHLTTAGYDHHAGIGRHILGSQIFDYWKDPWGHVVEHFTDGDLLNASHPTGSSDPVAALGTQWGVFVA